jgi:hypothetical protein
MIASQNVVSFRAQLNNESDPAKRIALQRLLVKELDRLGTTFELLGSPIGNQRLQAANCRCTKRI